ncbi:MAG: hypothetical protein QG656_287, partial [Candidatus Hydrogenedentes bacterium]|nr:hypothetical protein [Candidatus Hydrogenedentota bacterium]
PWSAGVIVVEAALTYGLVWFLFEWLPRRGVGQSVFGRDRFFAILLGSVAVRLVCDVWLLPQLGAYATEHLGIAFDYRNNLHSFGLIIVALIANQFWKPGLWRGFLPVFVSVGITYLIVRYGLMRYTNFSVSSLSYMYEDIAASMLASPKAYIILLTSAYIASRMNLLYGWEYSGILLPSLLSLVWYQPIKIAASVFEALAVLVLASMLLRLPLFRRTTVEGARKLILFGTVSYAYKFAISYGVLWLAPELKITDYFGFGYLLSTLIAMKMHEKGATARVMRATLQTSLTAVVVASVIGFGLTFLPNPWLWRTEEAVASEPAVERLTEQNLMDLVREEKVEVYRSRFRTAFETPSPGQADVFAEAVRTLLTYVRVHGGETLDPANDLLREARDLLSQIHYSLIVVGDRYLCLLERDARRGWGVFVLNTSPKNDLTVEVPEPLSEKGCFETGTWFFLTFESRALALAGAGRNSSEDGSADVLRNGATLYQTFHEVVGRNDVLQVRGYTGERLRAIQGLRSEGDEPASALWVKKSLPPSLNLTALKAILGEFRIEWGITPLANLQRDAAQSGFGELVLNRRDLYRVLFDPLYARQEVPLTAREQRIDGYLREWLLASKERIAGRGTDKYVVARLEELLYLDDEVLTPLLRMARTEYVSGEWTEQGLDELRSISASAAVCGYELIRYREVMTGKDYVILIETGDLASLRHWGTYVFRLGGNNPYVVQIPRPLFEVNTFEYGVALFEQLNAGALLISGTNPYANRDGSADPIRIENKENLFALVNQVVLRDAAEGPMMTVQTRAFGVREGRPMPDADVLVALDNGACDTAGLSLLADELVRCLDNDGLQTAFVDGSPGMAGYEVGWMPQSLYLTQTVHKEMAILWLSPITRASYRQQTENQLERRRFDALDVATVEEDLYAFLTRDPQWESGDTLPTGLFEDLRAFLISQDILCLQSFLRDWPQFTPTRLIDLDSKQSFLVLRGPAGGIALVANLMPRAMEETNRVARDSVTREQIVSYIDSRNAWLTFGAAP